MFTYEIVTMPTLVDEFINKLLKPETYYSSRENFSRTESEYHITLNVAGTPREDIAVTIDQGMLRLKAGKLEKKYDLSGMPMNLDAIKAVYKDGLLTVTLPLCLSDTKTRLITVE